MPQHGYWGIEECREDDGGWVILAPDGHKISWSAKDFTHYLVVSHIESRYDIKWDKQPYLMNK